MKAVVWTAYGSPDVLQLQDVERPTPKDNELLVRVHAATVTAGDCEVRNLQFPFPLGIAIRLYTGWRKPTRATILGQEFSGEIVETGNAVQEFQVGDAIFGRTDFAFGAYAEYMCVPLDNEDIVVAKKPGKMTHAEAATVPTGGMEALHFLRAAKPQPGQSILINGSGGSIGTYAVQLAKREGLVVTAVDSTAKLALLRELGADHVIDYTQEDFTSRSERYDILFDVVGKGSFRRKASALKADGRYLMANPQLGAFLQALWINFRSDKHIIMQPNSPTTEDLLALKALIEDGHLTSVIDRYYPLEQTAEAHHYVETGQKAGHVVITVAS